MGAILTADGKIGAVPCPAGLPHSVFDGIRHPQVAFDGVYAYYVKSDKIFEYTRISHFHEKMAARKYFGIRLGPMGPERPRAYHYPLSLLVS